MSRFGHLSTLSSDGPRGAYPPRRRASRPLIAALLAVLVAGGCAHKRPRAHVNFPPPPQPAPTGQPPGTLPPANPPAANVPPSVPGHWMEKGLASWYGVPYHGHRAADGEIYDMYQLTAAHRTLPFNSIVRVTNLTNGRRAEVRINDRGPFVEGRVIDLSLAAARALDLVAAGVAPVRLELLSGPNPDVGLFTVQVGAFLVQDNAERLRQQLGQRYQQVFIQEYDSPTGVFFRVRVGKVPSQDGARQLAQKMQQNEQLVPFVVRLDQ